MPEPLWTFLDIAQTLRTPVPEATLAIATGVSIDTRTLKPGDLFVAIKGERTDGHAYLAQAAAAGASAAIVEHGAAVPAEAKHLPVFAVEDTLEALNALARAARARTAARVIGVTGSVGKTGTKEMLRLILSASRKAHVSEKSYNNLWGVPLSLARMPRETAFAAFEMGMNHANEIRPLTKLVRPHVAIITTVAPVHIEFFDSVEGIADAKAEIMEGVEPGGAAVLPADNEHYGRLTDHARKLGVEVIPFGAEPRSASRLLHVGSGEHGIDARAVILGRDIRFTLPVPGAHLALNAVAALTAAALAGADLEGGAHALAAFEAPEGRGKRAVFETGAGPVLLIDETYNANPASMRAALHVLGSTPAPYARKIAVLGDMLELGHGGPRYHAELAAAVEGNGIDLVFCAGPLMQHLFEALPAAKRGDWQSSADALEPHVAAAITGGDAVMIKGSLGMKMGALAASLAARLKESHGRPS